MKVTNSTKPLSDKEIKRNWHLIDMKKKVLGRTAPEIVSYLTGKNKRNYVSYLDMGDNVVVINASSVMVSGKKAAVKEYQNYSGYPGGLRTISFRSMKEKKPEEIIKRAVSGMLPKNKLRKLRLTRLFVFAGSEHSYKEMFKTV